jgi:phosphoribosylformylglycinamidine synthase subunit PurQ / glutaminase
MLKKPKVCILRTAGTNCDKETAFAFQKAGSETELVHVNRLANKEKSISDFDILAIPGGFSYGDDAGAGRILANELRFKLIEDIRKFISDGKLIIGICNGFQILVKSGLLPEPENLEQRVSLIINDSNKFEDRWVYLKPGGRCVWTRGLDEVIYLPVAHGEGKFVTSDKQSLVRLKNNKQIVFQYCDEQGKSSIYPGNPNGSEEDIAGICDKSGRILGLMPHPERHIEALQHPRHFSRNTRDGDGIKLFKNGVEYARKHL